LFRFSHKRRFRPSAPGQFETEASDFNEAERDRRERGSDGEDFMPEFQLQGVPDLNMLPWQ
jgi:hypothetical protein